MQFIDTHTHLFLPEFESDRDSVIQRAISLGVSKMILPNVDTETLLPMIKLCEQYPENCFPLTGLHPGSVDNNFEKSLAIIEHSFKTYNFIGIGEIGIDFYWDTTFKEQQKEVFIIQLEWAKRLNLPVAIHVRNSFREVIEIVSKLKNSKLTGVFHCFTGNVEEAQQIIDLGFYLGIGGVVTFKNSGLPEVLKTVSPENIILETDSPYLAPVPNRGKRNDSSNIPFIAQKIAGIYNITISEVAKITTQNATDLFNLKT